jgi:hypothetical protein
MKQFLFLLLFACSVVISRVLVISGRGGRCSVPIGDYFISLFIISTTDWCNRHGYSFKMRSSQSFPHLVNHYAKIGHLLDEMRANYTRERFDWFMWIDNDTLVSDPIQSLPLEGIYSNVDIVLEGRKNELEKTPVDMFSALNTGVILLRNCPASVEFLENVAYWAKKDISKELEGQFVNWQSLQDQKIITWLIWKRKADWKILLDERGILNGYWTSYSPFSPEKRPLIKHWAGCKFCEIGSISGEKRQKCIDDYLSTWHQLNL